MNHHLSEITSQAAADRRAVVILDRGLTTSHYGDRVPIARNYHRSGRNASIQDPPLQPRFVSIVKGHCICSRSAAGFLLMIETQGLDWRAGPEHRQTPKSRPGPLARLYRARKLTQLGPVFHRLDCRAPPHPLALSLQPIGNDDVARTGSTTRQGATGAALDDRRKPFSALREATRVVTTI